MLFYLNVVCFKWNVECRKESSDATKKLKFLVPQKYLSEKFLNYISFFN